MVSYSRHQLYLLLGLVVAAGAGLAIGEWRRANPDIAATIESLDRIPDDDRQAAASPPPRREPAPRAPESSTRTFVRTPAKDHSPREPVDINRATADELTRLPGIGPVLAERIVTARETRGPFGSVDDLRRVSGVGTAKLAALREFVVVSRSE